MVLGVWCLHVTVKAKIGILYLNSSSDLRFLDAMTTVYPFLLIYDRTGSSIVRSPVWCIYNVLSPFDPFISFLLTMLTKSTNALQTGVKHQMPELDVCYLVVAVCMVIVSIVLVLYPSARDFHGNTRH